MFKSIVAAAGLAGLLSSLLLTGVQQLQIAPLILVAESYEQAAAQTPNTAHAHAASDAWTPQMQLRRTLATTLANIVVATGFALLLASALSCRGVSGWRAGVLWGIAGYVVFLPRLRSGCHRRRCRAVTQHRSSRASSGAP